MAKVKCDIITCINNDGKCNCQNEELDLKYVDDYMFLKDAKMPDGSSVVDYISNRWGHFMGLSCKDFKMDKHTAKRRID